MTKSISISISNNNRYDPQFVRAVPALHLKMDLSWMLGLSLS